MRRLLPALLALLSLAAFLSPPVHAATTAAVFPAQIIGEDFPDPDRKSVV